MTAKKKVTKKAEPVTDEVAEVVEAEVIPKGKAKKPKQVVAATVRCDYCRDHHSKILEPARPGETILSMFKDDRLVTEIPIDKLITNSATCPSCGTPIPMRIRADETTAFISRQVIRAKGK